MINDRLTLLRDYPFRRLNDLLTGLEPPSNVKPLIMSIGEPQHPYPEFVTEVLKKHAGLWGKYPPTSGTSEFRRAVRDWVTQRYGLPPGMIEPDRNILPVAGTREALFSAALFGGAKKKTGGTTNCLNSGSILPNILGRSDYGWSRTSVCSDHRGNWFLA